MIQAEAAFSTVQARRTAWLAVGLLWVVGFLNYFDRLVISSMREPILADVPMTEAQFGLLTSVFLWVYGCASPLCGFLGDRYSRRNIIFASLLVWSSTTWLTGYMQSYTGLLITRALMGFSEACYIPAAAALIADHHRGATRSLANGLHVSGIYAGSALGGLGGFLAESVGWRAAFTLFGGAGIAYSLIIILCLSDAETGTEESGSPEIVRIGPALRTVIESRLFLSLLLLNVLVGVSNWAIYAWGPTYLRERFGLGLGSAGLSGTAWLQAASFIGVVAGGIWTDRWFRRHRGARFIVPAIGYATAAPALWVFGSSDSLVVAIGALVVCGLGRGFYDGNLMPMIRTVVDGRYSATAYGLLNFTGCLAAGATTYAAGALRDANVDLAWVFRCAGAGLTVTAFLLFFLRQKTRKSLS